MPRLSSFFQDPGVADKFSMARLVMFMLTLTACASMPFGIWLAFKNPKETATIGTVLAAIGGLVTGGVLGIWGKSKAQTIDGGGTSA